MSGFRLPAPQGAWIDRSQAFSWRFDGREVAAFAGDTLASSLLAAGIMQIGRSFKLHRSRGLLSIGADEPNAVLDVGTGAHRVPDARATLEPARAGLEASSVNRWPSLRFDAGALLSAAGALLPAGFYYKTFLWPRWTWYEPLIRALAGLGRAGDGPDPDRYEQRSLVIDLLVIGAGDSGLEAAIAAAQGGRQVMVLEMLPCVENAALARRARSLGVHLALGTTALGVYDHLLVAAVERPASTDAAAPRERLWKIRARQLILATGSLERPMLFPDNDRPGVMLAAAVVDYARRYGVGCGRRIAIAAGCDAAYRSAAQMRALGLNVVAIVDLRPQQEIDAVVPEGVELIAQAGIVGVEGRRALRAIDVAGLDGRALRRLDVDLVASSAGPTPDLALFSQAGGTLRWCARGAMFVPDRLPADVAVTGAAAGLFDAARAREHAQALGRWSPGTAAPPLPPADAGIVRADASPGEAALRARGRRRAKVFVDLQNDVTLDDIALAARENYRSVEHLKRYTTTGMATDQGRTSNVNALVQLGRFTDREPPQVGTTRFRPPYMPVTLGTLAAGQTGARARPLKPLPARGWHAERGALFEDFGGWERPAAYPLPGESLEQAAEREAALVRAGVGLFDGSPLGKIEVFGPDAARFLDLMYVQTMSSLAVGGARYGMLLNEHGIVTDDGIVARLGDEHFWINTTSTGADRVARHFEEWRQCEFIHLRVLIAPVSSRWANVTVAGPQAWRTLERAGFDAALSPSRMKHMTMQESRWQGHAVRVMRASFSGELGYEINLPPSQCRALLERLWAVGESLGRCAYGVEAAMILRLEKGYLHVGADTDGTTTPGDVGFDRGIAKKQAHFVGRRSLLRENQRRPDRLQLVGVQPVDRRSRLRVGAHLARQAPPSLADGYVSSSAFSPALRQPIALAMLRSGRERIGERLGCWHLGERTEVEIVATPFFDAAGERLDV